MRESVTCFLPCRKGSERVPYKNTKPFSRFDHGLIELKLAQLIATKEIDRILLSTNDEDILDFARGLGENKIVLHKRVAELSSSETRTDDLVGHALELIEDGHILWTHVTSPFVNAEAYSKIIKKYRHALHNGYDSLMTTTPVHGFLWDKDQPINYDRSTEKWPRTQTLKPLHEVNSGAFLTHRDNYRDLKDRIGTKPYLYPLSKLEGHDVDWEEDFIIAELLANSGVVAV